MHIRCLILLAVMATGAVFLAFDHPFDTGTWPLPGSHLSVRVPLDLPHSGDFWIELTMPKASTDKLHTVDETLSCDLSYTVEKNGIAQLTKNIKTISSTGEYGWANVVLYSADTTLHFARGSYVIVMTGGPDCSAARERGATFAISEANPQPTERYLRSTLLRFLARLVLFGGLSVIAVAELRAWVRDTRKQ